MTNTDCLETIIKAVSTKFSVTRQCIKRAKEELRMLKKFEIFLGKAYPFISGCHPIDDEEQRNKEGLLLDIKLFDEERMRGNV